VNVRKGKKVNLKFWEWFKKKQESDPNADPTSLNTLNEYQKAVGIERKPLQKIDRFEGIGNGVAFSEEVKGPDLGTDDAQDLKRKLKHGIHQSVQTGNDNLSLGGVKAIGGEITIIGKVDKSKLYELGYDIKEESAAMVASLGLEPGEDAGKPVVAPDDTPEEKVLEMEGVRFAHHAGKPSDRPWEMRSYIAPEAAEEGVTDKVPDVLVATLGNIEEETKARIGEFHAKAKNHDTYCELYQHFTEHIDDHGNEFDCFHMCGCKKRTNGDDQGDLAPV